jgi:hypothetical protein
MVCQALIQKYLEEVNWGHFGEVWFVKFLTGSLLADIVDAI